MKKNILKSISVLLLMSTFYCLTCNPVNPGDGDYEQEWGSLELVGISEKISNQCLACIVDITNSFCGSRNYSEEIRFDGYVTRPFPHKHRKVSVKHTPGLQYIGASCDYTLVDGNGVSRQTSSYSNYTIATKGKNILFRPYVVVENVFKRFRQEVYPTRGLEEFEGDGMQNGPFNYSAIPKDIKNDPTTTYMLRFELNYKGFILD